MNLLEPLGHVCHLIALKAALTMTLIPRHHVHSVQTGAMCQWVQQVPVTPSCVLEPRTMTRIRPPHACHVVLAIMSLPTLQGHVPCMHAPLAIPIMTATQLPIAFRVGLVHMSLLGEREIVACTTVLLAPSTMMARHPRLASTVQQANMFHQGPLACVRHSLVWLEQRTQIICPTLLALTAMSELMLLLALHLA